MRQLSRAAIWGTVNWSIPTIFLLILGVEYVQILNPSDDTLSSLSNFFNEHFFQNGRQNSKKIPTTQQVIDQFL